MDREYVLCSEGHKAFRIPGEKYYYCSECQLKFTSEDKPMIDSGERVVDVKPNEEEPKEEEPMAEKKKKICKEPECEEIAITKGHCLKHYNTKWRGKHRRKQRASKPKARVGRPPKEKKEISKEVKITTGKEPFRQGQCNSCLHKKVCGIIPQCKDYMPTKD